LPQVIVDETDFVIPEPSRLDPARVPLAVVAREWTRIGCIGFGGPPTHISLLRRLCVTNRGWLDADEFEDAVAATNLLPGPASTQLAIFCAWRLRGAAGAVLGGLCFIVPGLALILVLSAVFLQGHPPHWLAGAADGAGAAVPAVAVSAAVGLIPASWRRSRTGRRPAQVRWVGYLLAGGASAALLGPYLVLVLLACGVVEALARRPKAAPPNGLLSVLLLAPTSIAVGGTGALVWVALKVGLLSYGGGFVIVPLMQHDAVIHYHWMSAGQFLNAVALGQVTPGPVVQTVAAIGYAAHGLTGGLLAAAVAFAPSFVFVLAGGSRFDRLRDNQTLQAFLTGAGPAAIGGILGSSIPLARALTHPWQAIILGLAAVWLLALRRGVVSALLGAGVLGVAAAAVGFSI
jgi:chromate transporter